MISYKCNPNKKVLPIRILSFLPPLLVMGLIFYLSGQNQLVSGNLSYPVTNELVLWFDRTFHLDLSSEQLLYYTDLYHFLVRKLGHMSIYCVLSMTLYVPFRLYRLPHPYPISWLICIVYAVTDEFHQHFAQGRTPSAADVLIDGIGAFIGLLAVSFFLIVLHRIRLYTEKKKSLRRHL